MSMEGVYLLHFDTPLRRDARASVSHYIGFSTRIDDRLQHHINGHGNGLVAAAASKGPVRLVRVWLGADRHFERFLKNKHNTKAFCPICCARDRTPMKEAWPPGRQPRALRGELDVMRQALTEWRKSRAASERIPVHA
jgi:hypothetical protein